MAWLKSRAALALIVSIALSATVWALSIPFTGAKEPWDAEPPYYFLGLIAAGGIAGALVPRPLWAHYVGAILGQTGYELAFLPLGPLFVLGLAYLAGFSLLFVVAAAVVAACRVRDADPGR